MRFSNILHLLLLAYIIAALSFWWLSLEKQSKLIFENEIVNLKDHVNPSLNPGKYEFFKNKIENRREKRSKQYLGEGITFLVLTLIGSWIVYSNYKFSSKLARQQNNFMLSVTHELKSPIASIKLTLQTLLRHKLDHEKQLQLISNCIQESDRLNDLCENVLIASQMEGGHYFKDWKTVSITQLIQEAFDQYNLRYPSRFDLKLQDDLLAETDPILLHLALNNLIENALKYSPEDSIVRVSAAKVANNIRISVIDYGPGIKEIEKKRIFKQFYRIGDENTRKTKGTGLGLYLSKKIMKTLKGEISVEDNAPNGCVFSLSIPLNSA
jgi:K+-sensing histidine kinase KdpD